MASQVSDGVRQDSERDNLLRGSGGSSRGLGVDKGGQRRANERSDRSVGLGTGGEQGNHPQDESKASVGAATGPGSRLREGHGDPGVRSSVGFGASGRRVAVPPQGENASSRYASSNLEGPHDGRAEPRWRWTRGDGLVESAKVGFCERRVASMFWPEKLLVMLQAVQWFALLWAYMRPRPWPLNFRRAIGPVVWVNADWVSDLARRRDGREVDVGTATTYVSPWGEMEGFWMYATGWAALPFAVIVLAWVGEGVAWCQERHQQRTRMRWRDALRGLGIALQLPALVTLLRVYDCEAYTESFLEIAPDAEPQTVYRMGAEPSFECLSWQHWALMGGCLPAALLFAVGLPWYLGVVASKNTIYDAPRQHERYLRWREAEYELGLGVQWRHAGMWVMSSFRRGFLHPWDRALWAASSSALALMWIFLRDYPELQVDLFLVVIVLWGIRQWYHPAFRSMTTNLVAWACHWWIAVCAFLTALRVHGVRTEVTVASRFADWLRLSCIVAASLCGGAVLLALWPHWCLPRFLRDPWPTAVLTDQADLPRLGMEELAGLGPALPEVGPRLFPAGIAADRAAKQAAARGNDAAQKAVAAAAAVSPYSGSAGDLSEGDAYLFGMSLWPGPPRRPSSAGNSSSGGRGRERGAGGGPPSSAGGMSPTSQGTAGAARALLADWGLAGDDSSEAHSDGRMSSGEAGGLGSGSASVRSPGVGGGAGVFPGDAYGSEEKGGPRSGGKGRGVGLSQLLRAKASFLRDRRRIEHRAAGSRAGAGALRRQKLAMGLHSSRRLLDPLGADGGAGGRGGTLGAFGAGAGAVGSRPGTASGYSTASGSTAAAPRADSVARSRGKLSSAGGLKHAAADLGQDDGSLAAVEKGQMSAEQAERELWKQLFWRPLDTLDVLRLERRWVLMVRAARDRISRAVLGPPELVHCPALRAAARQLREDMQLANKAGHVFAWSLQEAMEDCADLAQAASPISALEGNRTLQRTVMDLSRRMRQRRLDFALVDPRKRRILMKLLALRCWLGRRRVAKVPLRQLRALTMALRRGDADAAAATDQSILDGLEGVHEVEDIDDDDEDEDIDEGAAGGGAGAREDAEMGVGLPRAGSQAGAGMLPSQGSVLLMPGNTDERQGAGLFGLHPGATSLAAVRADSLEGLGPSTLQSLTGAVLAMLRRGAESERAREEAKRAERGAAALLSGDRVQSDSEDSEGAGVDEGKGKGASGGMEVEDDGGMGLRRRGREQRQGGGGLGEAARLRYASLVRGGRLTRREQRELQAARLLVRPLRERWDKLVSGWEEAYRVGHSGLDPSAGEQASIVGWYEARKRLEAATPRLW